MVGNQFAALTRSAIRMAAAGAMAIATFTAASAQDAPSADDIVKALTPKPLTRSLVQPAPAVTPAQAKLIEKLKSTPTRAITVEQRTEVAEIAKALPAIDIEIFFDFDSAEIGPATKPALDALGQAISSSELAGSTFMLGGHTDGKGSADYNQSLSERRALAVKQYLIDTYGIADAGVIALGYGFEQLKNPADPLAAENRRVQIVNLTVAEQ